MSYRNPLHGFDSDGEPVQVDPVGGLPVHPVEQEDEPDGLGAVPVPPPHLGDDDRAQCLIKATERYAYTVGLIMGEHASPAKVADATTETMRATTGHDCPACPTVVRDLYAVAYNAVTSWRADPNRAEARTARKMAELANVLERLRPIVDAHFEALHQWNHQ